MEMIDCSYEQNGSERPVDLKLPWRLDGPPDSDERAVADVSGFLFTCPRYVFMGVSYTSESVSRVLPPRFEAAPGLTGGVCVFDAPQTAGSTPFALAWAWIDIKGFDTPDGAAGRYIVDGFGSPAAQKVGQAYNQTFKPGRTREQTTRGVVTANGGPDGEGIRLRVRPFGRSRRAAYVVNYVALNGAGEPTVMPHVITNAFRSAEPLALAIDLPPSGPLGLLRPASLLWAARPADSRSFVGPKVSGFRVWSPDAARRKAEAELSRLLENLRWPALLVGSDGRIAAINRPAGQLCGDGFTVVNGWFRSADRVQQAAVERQIEAALEPGSDGSLLEPVALKRTSGRNPLILQVIPLGFFHPETADLVPSSRGEALILITDPDRPPRDTARELELLGLTPAEARAASLIGRGLSFPEAADRLGLSQGSLRVTTSRAYSKLGLSRQSELALLAARIESVLPGGQKNNASR